MPIRKREYTRDGRKWTRFVATYDGGFDPAGHRNRMEKSFRRERDAKEWIAEQRALASAGIAVGGRVPTVAEHINEWLSRGKTRTRRPWAPITAHGYESVARTWLVPHLGRIPLDKLTVDHVEAMLDQVPGGKHAQNIRGALSSALAMAVKQRLIPYNVAEAAARPEDHSKEVEPLSSAEARQFLASVSDHRLGALFTVTTALALRPSEAFGLRWQDVDLDNRRLRIEQKIYHLNGVYHTGDPKSQRSRREIIFPPEIEHALRQHRQALLEEQLASTEWRDQGLVFPNTTGGPLYPSYVTRTMQMLLGRAGLPRRRMYDLRHTGASMLLAMGVDIRVIQQVLGHADYRITANTYVHPDEMLREDAADKMGAFLRG